MNDGSLHQTKDLKSLSGGEKSFTTLSFMLALGEAMNVPFRVMDEFDVFMDEANRRAAYVAVVEAAREMPHRQFIFLTPLSIPVESSGTAVQIKRLPPPDRMTQSSARQRLISDFDGE
mmetsp:Transcript_7388/g.19323  ORF Transcript_7388/g.19323 Transcript_7388/m.19323 type:complete len:118 (-) Transcript_7388:1109-1462(-)